MAKKRGKKQYKENNSSSVEEQLINSNTATPVAKPLSEGAQAFQLATENKREIATLKEEFFKPSWLKDFIVSLNSIVAFIKIIVIIFLLLLIVCLIVFVAISYFQLNHLLLILESIKDNKSMEINQELLKSFQEFYDYAKQTISIYVSFIISIGIFALLATFVLKLSERLLDQRKK